MKIIIDKKDLSNSPVVLQHLSEQKKISDQKVRYIKSLLKSKADAKGRVDIATVLKIINHAELSAALTGAIKFAKLQTDFRELFKGQIEYEKIMQLLVAEKWIDANGTWIANGGGKKSLFIWFIRLLEHKEYFVSHVTNNAIKQIAKKTFGLSVSVRRINDIELDSLRPMDCPFFDQL